jgi:long-chain acyl-CoA synthetase
MPFTLAEIVRSQARARPDGEALACGETRLTWAGLHQHSSQVANALRHRGVSAGDRVAVLARNNVEFFEVAFGVAKLGAVTVGLNWRLAAPELAAVLEDAEPRALLVDDDSASLLPDDVECGTLVLRYGEEYRTWRDAAPDVDPGAPAEPDEVAYMLYSSGTTGVPKGVTITHANLACSERMAREGFRMGADSVQMCAGPQFHIAGAGTGLMSMFAGGRTIIIADPQPPLLLETIARERVTHAFLVPALIQALIDSPQLADYDVSSLRQISYGAAPMTEVLLRRAMQALRCTFLGVYGMTETAGTVSTLTPEDHHVSGERSRLLRSVGKPLPWIELKVADREGGAECPPGEVGEVWVRSAQNTPGYWRQAQATVQAITPDGWLRTGDGAYRDEQGYLFLKDRIKDMIISGGENVYPAEVENALADHPDISEVAVIGVPHEHWGETVKAMVVLREGANADAEGIRAFARTRIAAYKCPTSVDFVGALPRNPSGKVLKRELRAAYTPTESAT